MKRVLVLFIAIVLIMSGVIAFADQGTFIFPLYRGGQTVFSGLTRKSDTLFALAVPTERLYWKSGQDIVYFRVRDYYGKHATQLRILTTSNVTMPYLSGKNIKGQYYKLASNMAPQSATLCCYKWELVPVRLISTWLN